MNKKLNSIALAILLVTSTFTFLGAFTLFPHQAEAQGLQLRVSAAERPQFQNHFFGPQIVQVIIDDPNATDIDDSTVGLQVKGVTVPRVHLGDGLWYNFFAEQAAFLLFLDVVTDGIRDTNIRVQRAALSVDNPAAVAGFTQTFSGDFGTLAVPSTTKSPVREITQIAGAGTIFVEMDRSLVFPTLPTSVNNVANTDKDLKGAVNSGAGGIGTDTIPSRDASETAQSGVNPHSDWPFIVLTGINELDQVNVRAGSASVNLTFDDFNESVSAIIDRSAAYPVNAEVIVSYTDFMWNINPVEEDVVNWVLDKTTGNPTGVFYQFNRGHAIAFNAGNVGGLLGNLFRPNLNFDTRQILELDSEGITTMKFFNRFDPGLAPVVQAAIGGVRDAANSRLVSQAPFTTATTQPVIKMIESDPNTSFFESIDEQAGSISDLFTGFNDKVANFDYFDIINSAAMTQHDGFATVDREVYDSADRAVFTVTDPDQNLRSRVSEQPSALRSNSFVSIGKPFPLANNPTFTTFLGKVTVNEQQGAGVTAGDFDFASTLVGATQALTLNRIQNNAANNLLAPIRTAGMFQGVDPDDVTVVANANAVIAGTACGATSPRNTACGIANEIVTAVGAVNPLITAPTLNPLRIVAVTAATGVELAGVAAKIVDFTGTGTVVNNGGVALVAGEAWKIDITPANVQIFLLDLNKNGFLDLGGTAFTGEVLSIAGETAFGATTAVVAATDTSDIRDATPFDSARAGRTQKAALDFTSVGIGAGADKSSAIIVNTNINLADLNKFQNFVATGDQIVRNNGDGVIPSGDDKPLGQAFPLDPQVLATGIFTTPGTAADTVPTVAVTRGGALAAATPFRVMVPEYNLIRADFSELFTGTEAVTADRVSSVAVQIEAICPTTTCGPNGKIVRQLVDFTPFEAVDTDNIATNDNVGLLGSTKIGTGVFRVADLLMADWGGAVGAWPVDAAEATNFFPNIKLRFTIVTIGTNAGDHTFEPSEVIDVTSHVMGLDIDGLVTVIPPPVLLNAAGAKVDGTATFPATRTIDEVTLLAVEHNIYRIQVKEQGSNSSIFTGRMDFETANQLDTVQRALSDIVFSGDPAKAFMPNRFIPPNRLAFAYSDVDIVDVFRATSASFIYETRDGSVEWDKQSYSFGQDAFLTLTDEDLNRRPDATERFDLPIAGFVFFELGKKRVDDTCAKAGNQATSACIFDFIDGTLLETGPNTGTFVAQISMPALQLIAKATTTTEIQGLASNTGGFELVPILPVKSETSTVNQKDLEANYIDVRDKSSIRNEFDDVANIRTTLGDVVLDRAAYPPGALMYVEIHDNDFNTDVDIRETINLNQIVITTGDADNKFSFGAGPGRIEGDILSGAVAGGQLGTCTNFILFLGTACGGGTPSSGAAPIIEINVFRTGVGRLVTLLPAGMINLPATGTAGVPAAPELNDRFGTGITTTAAFAILPILDRNSNAVTTALETGPNTGIFEFEVQLPGPAKEPRFPFTLPAVLTTGTLIKPSITSNQPIQVTYTDPATAAGDTDDVEELATFLTNTARLRTDKLEYGLGDRVDVIVEEPDFNRDSRAIDEVEFSILDIVTDKFDTEFGANPNTQDFGTVVNSITDLRMNQTRFRESNFNSGVFVVAMEEITKTLIDRGETARILYFDRTPSGGGSEIRVQYTFFVVSILPEIIFDKEEYTPFDEVTVSIISPDSNNDKERIEQIQPLISTSSESLGRKGFPETGPSTGIFEEDFDLTPDKTRFPGDVRAIREDGVTVEFRIDSDTVATKSVFVNYHVGQVMYDKDAFRIDERGVLRVIDPDANKNPNTIDTTNVRFWSTTDRGGLLVTLRETGDRTGIFEEIVTFTPDEESSGTRLRVTEGDTITAKFTDNTLPAPAALDAQETFTVEVEELFASALIGSIVPPLERAVASVPELVDQTGAKLTDVSAGSQVLIQSTITNSQTKKQPFAYIVQIKDKNGVTTSLSWVTGELPAKESLAAAQSWIPDAMGEYTVEVFVWQSIDNPTALSPVQTTTVAVK